MKPPMLELLYCRSCRRKIIRPLGASTACTCRRTIDATDPAVIAAAELEAARAEKGGRNAC